MISSKELTNKLPPYLGVYIQSIFDPRQTHAVYGLCEHTAPQCKDQLKQLGATQFRTVKCKNHQGKPNGFLILCFNSKKINA
jgi:hypothetical protein